MHKDELIQLHTLLCQVRKVFEDSGLGSDAVFKDYEALGVSPHHIHKSKQQHKKAVFLLGKDLADAISGRDELSNAHKIGVRLSELAKKGAPKGLTAPATLV